MSDCSYCGSLLDSWVRRCAGCGSPRASKPIDREDRAFAKIGRAVIARDADGVIDWLERHQPKPDESAERCWSRRSFKGFIAIGVLMVYPQILLLGATLGLIFVVYVYLPRHGLRLLLDWLAK